MSSIWGEFESTVNQRLIEIVAKQAHQTLERELRARQVDFRIDSLASIWQGLLSSLSARHCERLLVEWGDVMGKPKGARYVTKPPWWPRDQVFKPVKGLSVEVGSVTASPCSTAEGTVDGSSVADNAGPIWVFTGSPGSVEDNQALKAI
ncbi:hypothetical protein N7494_013319 [Penicillium frequentans]|uniref:Uncharacterized protein n=1 Tax=Penicillium frequentans TaxID=3151616 RepID=A0AAD6CH72_9EURO|nr:hypothetical protein N7494_013319 [Penicillium glabrum]